MIYFGKRQFIITLAVFSLFLLTAGSINKASWPPLPKTGFISGKPAVKADVDAKKAVFAFIHVSKRSVPLKISIPQYGILKLASSNKKIRIIVVQAEKVNGMDMLGYVNVKTGKRAIALLRFVKLLGQKKSRH